MKHCPNCGGEIDDGAKFCTWCGSAIAAAAAPVATAVATAVADPAPRPVTTASPVQTGYTQQSYSQPVSYSQTTYTQPQQTSYTQSTYYTQPTYSQPAAKKTDGLGIAAIVFMVLAILWNIGYLGMAASDSELAGAVPFYGLVLIVSIVLTVFVVKFVKSKEKVPTWFKIVTLLFGSLISGILLLVRKEDQL